MSSAESEYHSRYFSTRFGYDQHRDVVWREVCRYLQPRDIPSGGVVLELGAGHGHFINQVRGRMRHALDLSPDLPQRVAAGVEAHVGSCTSLPMFGDGSVDVVFASNLFEHLTREELAATLKEVHRVLRSGGRLVIIQPNFKFCAADSFDDYTHLQVFTHVSLADRLMADGFRILRVVARFLPFSMKSRLPKSSALVWLYLRSPFKPFGAQMLVIAQKA
jgi:ubiquinone/menaquinone biosynthesis C-methylase UbiE